MTQTGLDHRRDTRDTPRKNRDPLHEASRPSGAGFPIGLAAPARSARRN
jgi:hypothetical protein